MAGKPFIFMGGKNHKPPMFKEVKDGQIYLYGENASNLVPDYLIDLYTRSPKHRAIIEGKVRFTCGGGWNVNSYSERIDLNAKATYAINNANEEETWNDLTEKLDTDFEIFGGYAVECIWNRTSERIASYHYVPFAKIRLAKTETGDYKWCYLPDWKGITKYEKAKEKEGFKEWNNLGETREKSEIYVRVSSRPTKSAEIAIYPRPSYEAAIPYIEADSQIANYTINNINNNFWGGTIVEMQNVFSTEEEKESFEREWDEQKSGTDNAGKALLIFKRRYLILKLHLLRAVAYMVIEVAMIHLVTLTLVVSMVRVDSVIQLTKHLLPLLQQLLQLLLGLTLAMKVNTQLQ